MIRFSSYRKNIKRYRFTYIDPLEVKQAKKGSYSYAILYGGAYIVFSPRLKKNFYVLGIGSVATLLRIDVDLLKSGKFPRRIWFLSAEDFLTFKKENEDRLKYLDFENKQEEEILSEIKDKYGKIVYSKEKIRVGKYIQE